MRLLIVGAGATGGYFGGRLAQAGREVSFLVRPARAAQLRAEGLQVISPHGDFNAEARLVTADAIDGPYDAVLLAVKAYSLDAALGDIAAAVGPDTMIVPVLNGMRHMDTLIARFGAEAVVGGVCKIAATIDERGRIVQMSQFHSLAYGEMDGAVSPRIRTLDTLMQNAGFSAKLSTNIAREMWEKWAFLATLGGVTCLMRGAVGEIMAATGGRDFMNSFLDEVVSAITSIGLAPSEQFIAGVHATLTESDSTLTSSMYRDLQHGGPIEADQIIGDLLIRAQAIGLELPLLGAAYTQLALYQDRRTRLGRAGA